MLPDFYKVFGLNKNATKEDIKKRYRELAKKYHPDINKNQDATQKMQEILEAYYILSDDEARVRYNIQYEKVYGGKRESFNNESEKKNENRQTDYSTYYDDPILEKWILNAKKQALEFVNNLYRDTKGIATSGCSYYFKALGICIVIFILILIIIRIFVIAKT
jgi:curved DNA-binding protein CbpA